MRKISKLLLIFIMTISIANAFELRSWNLLKISENNIDKRDVEFMKNYIDEDYDVMCVQEVMSKNSLEYLTNKKNVYYSNIKSGRKTYKEFLGWFVDNKYKNNEIIDYYDTKDVFERDPSMLFMKDINIGIVNYHAIYAQKKSEEITGDKEGLTKAEIRNLPNLFTYFSKKTGLPMDRIFVCGDFNLSKGKIKEEIGDLYNIGNNLGSTVSTKYGYTRNDYDHIISFYEGNVFADHNLLNRYKSEYGVNDFEDFKATISDHIPVKGIF